jgi:hypothetical protein
MDVSSTSDLEPEQVVDNEGIWREYEVSSGQVKQIDQRGLSVK